MADTQPSPNLPDGFEWIACPCCGGTAHTLARQGRDWALDSNRLINVVRCNACGLHFVNPRPKIERLPAYYPEEYSPYQRQHGEIERGNKISTTTRLLVLRWAYGAPEKRPGALGAVLARMLTACKDIDSFGFGVPYRGGGKLLDFGCGGGTFLRRMAAVGWDVTGIDLSPVAVQAVRQGGLAAVQGTLPHPELKPRSFDVVTLNRALEHVPNPRQILHEVGQLLVPGGQVVIKVPNFDSWEIAYFGDAAHSLDLPRHLLQFIPATLQTMLQNAGFKDIQITQTCPTGSLRKSLAKVHQRGSAMPLDQKLQSKMFLRRAARAAVRTGHGTELLATATV